MSKVYVGGYGAGNLGDDLILLGILSQDKDAAVVSYGPPLVGKSQAYIAFPEFLENAHKLIPQYTTLIFGGGGLFWSHDHIYEMLALALMAKSFGLRVEMRRVGLHGFHLNMAASRHLVRIVDVLTVREHDSLDMARRILNCEHAYVERDFVEELVLTSTAGKKNKPTVGINVASTRFIHDQGFNSHVSTIYAEISSIFDGVLDFKYIPFCVHMSDENQNDLGRGDALFAASSGRIRYSDEVIGVQSLLSACDSSDILLGERFHMHVLAKKFGRVALPLIHNEQTKYRAIASEYCSAPVFYESSQMMIIDQIRRRIECFLGSLEGEIAELPTRQATKARATDALS
ncbi:hypothetical protein WSK_4165 [Novosphingobium sp. Rr 2-17]|uniref:polysaccharide pyruvyl transferase family protein n=1 Tax=Novosphingobium sp. Rr 2-17 TaxID=555793 RepID=UPI000269A56D|nr:polysaccharide pyruvyl transferase family protein [Novosphingobium sp. Rr 2-17]EIZ77276.1 hypothetical protein WSK_4165 [Novosphingobium sp. Rr 2-17]